MSDFALLGDDLLCDPHCTGELTIDGFPLNCPAWTVPNLVKLWTEFDHRGENLVLPGAPGRRSYPTRIDQTDFEMPFVLTGRRNVDGDPYSDFWVGLESNLNYLFGNIFIPVTVGRGIRAGSLTLPSGAVRTADVQVSSLRFPADPYDANYVEAVFTLTVVSGRFV